MANRKKKLPSLANFEPASQAAKEFEHGGRSEASTSVESPKKKKREATDWHRTVISFRPETVLELQERTMMWRRQAGSSSTVPVAAVVRASLEALMPLFSELEGVTSEDELLQRLKDYIERR
jgi:hypothetical protein